MSVLRRALIALLFAVGLAMVSTAPAGAQDGEGTQPQTGLDWVQCRLGALDVECANLVVPLDYADPNGQQIDLTVRRIQRDPADGPRRGSIVLNPGGPGAVPWGLLEAADANKLFPGWDLIAPDPRGLGDSQRLTCGNPFRVDLSPPTGNAFIDARDEAAAVAADCLSSDDGDVFQFMGTVNVARDFDRLRIALGQSRLDYFGASYGTHIGAVYAELFPKRVGRFVLDGPVLLDDRTRVRINQIRGNDDAFERFDAACASSSRCALQPYGARSVWRNVRWQLSRGSIPARLPSGGTTQATVATLDSATSIALYQGRVAWVLLADALLQAARGDGSLLVELAGLSGPSDDAGSVGAAHLAVTCNDDSRRATSTDAQRITATAVAAGNDVFTTDLGALIGVCQSVPISPATPPVLDVDQGETNTMLVIAATHDPATPYAGALHFVNRIRSTRLLTVSDDGHTMFGRGNRCVDGAVRAYLTSGALPPVNTVCEPTEGFLGVVFNTGGPNGGILVDSVVPSSAAEGSILPGDELLRFNGQPFAGIENGVTYDVSLVRDGEEISVIVIGGPPVMWLPG